MNHRIQVNNNLNEIVRVGSVGNGGAYRANDRAADNKLGTNKI